MDPDDKKSNQQAGAQVLFPIPEYINWYALPEAERARLKNQPSWNHERDQDGPDVLA